MKLRNLFLASLAVCTMVSCSKDDDTNNAPKAEVDASLAFVATSDILKTKATEAGSAKEDFINKLDVYIFKGSDGNATLVNKKTETAKGTETVSQIDHILVKVAPGATVDDPSTDQFVAYFMANCDDISATTLSDFEKAVAAKSVESYTNDETSSSYKNLPMAKKISFSGVKPLINSNGDYVENWIQNGGSVKDNGGVAKDVHDKQAVTPPAGNVAVVVERLVARIQVEQIEVDLSAISTGATFKLTDLALANVHTDVTPLGTVSAAGAGIWAKGYQGPEFSSKDAVVAPYATTAPYDAAVSSLVKHYDGLDAVNKGTYSFGETTPKLVSYVYPNDGTDKFKYTAGSSAVGETSEDANAYTLLLIAGDYKATSASTSVKRHFRVKIQHDKANLIDKVVANYIYKLTIKITGEGSGNEDDYQLNAHVAATIDVAPWNVIEQTEEDAN